MSETEEIALQWIDADVPISGAPVAKVLVLGALGPLNNESPKPDEALEAELAAQDFRCSALLVDAAFCCDSVSGKATIDWAARAGLDLASLGIDDDFGAAAPH